MAAHYSLLITHPNLTPHRRRPNMDLFAAEADFNQGIGAGEPETRGEGQW